MRLRNLQVLTCAFALAALAGGAWLLHSPNITPNPEVSSQVSAAPETATVTALNIPPSTPLVEALKRPLFRSDRKPFVPAPPPPPEIQVTQDRSLIEVPAPPPPPPPDLSALEALQPIDTHPFPQARVLGVHLSAVLSRALVALPERPQGEWLGLGADVSGWRIAAIENEGIVLERAGESRELKLYGVDNFPSAVGMNQQHP